MILAGISGFRQPENGQQGSICVNIIYIHIALNLIQFAGRALVAYAFYVSKAA